MCVDPCAKNSGGNNQTEHDIIGEIKNMNMEYFSKEKTEMNKGLKQIFEYYGLKDIFDCQAVELPITSTKIEWMIRLDAKVGLDHLSFIKTDASVEKQIFDAILNSFKPLETSQFVANKTKELTEKIEKLEKENTELAKYKAFFEMEKDIRLCIADQNKRETKDEN